MRTFRLPHHALFVALGLALIAPACEDDPDDSSSEGGSGGSNSSGGKSGSNDAGKGGSGSSKGGSGGSSGGGSGKGGTGGSGPKGGSGSSTMMTMPMQDCTEPAPKEALKCGDETCTPPTFMNNPCVVPCCIEKNGKPACGAKSTSAMFPSECAAPAVEDPSCPDVDSMQGNLAGCCNAAKGKCGIISSVRPGCITESMFVEIPSNTCGAGSMDTDAGMGQDAGL